MSSSEHHRRDISSATISTRFLLEFQPHSSHCPERGKRRAETAHALYCSVKNPVEKRVLVGTEKIVLVWPSEREKNGKIQHIILLQNCAWLHDLGQRSAENEDLGLLIIPLRFCLSTQSHFPAGCAEHYLPVILCIHSR